MRPSDSRYGSQHRLAAPWLRRHQFSQAKLTNSSNVFQSRYGKMNLHEASWNLHVASPANLPLLFSFPESADKASALARARHQPERADSRTVQMYGPQHELWASSMRPYMISSSLHVDQISNRKRVVQPDVVGKG